MTRSSRALASSCSRVNSSGCDTAGEAKGIRAVYLGGLGIGAIAPPQKRTPTAVPQDDRCRGHDARSTRRPVGAGGASFAAGQARGKEFVDWVGHGQKLRLLLIPRASTGNGVAWGEGATLENKKKRGFKYNLTESATLDARVA